MKWKPDSIEEFVKYKIQHPEESFITYKNYSAEKKHNQHIDQLYKDLNKYRSQLNHFKSELFKLNQVAAQELQTNSQEIHRIDQKANSINEKMAKAKSLSGVSLKERKRLIIEEYEQEISRIEEERQNFENQARRESEDIRKKIIVEMGENKREKMIEKIGIIKSKIEKTIKQNMMRKEKTLIINELTERHNILRQKVTLAKSDLKEKKAAIQKAKKAHEWAQQSEISQTAIRLGKFKAQFVSITDNLSQPSKIVIEDLLPVSLQPNVHQQRKWSQWKEEYQEGVQSVKEFLKRIQYYMENNFDQAQNKVEIDPANVQRSKKYLAEFQAYSQITALSQSVQNYLQIMANLTQKVQKNKNSSIEYFEKEQNQAIRKESELETKEKLLDKEITQLQAKVTKTDLEISKFSKYK